MKHPYTPGCACPRCTREAVRRDAQSRQTSAVRGIHRALSLSARRRERAYENWALNDNGPGDYEINGPDRGGDL